MTRAVVVTGASSGIGAATATLLAQRGFLTFAGVRTDAAAMAVAARHEYPCAAPGCHRRHVDRCGGGNGRRGRHSLSRGREQRRNRSRADPSSTSSSSSCATSSKSTSSGLLRSRKRRGCSIRISCCCSFRTTPYEGVGSRKKTEGLSVSAGRPARSRRRSSQVKPDPHRWRTRKPTRSSSTEPGGAGART